MRRAEEMDVAIRRLEDRSQIADLVVSFAVALDDRDLAALRALLDERVTWALGDAGVLHGPDAVVDHLAGRLEAFELTIHTPHAPLVRFTGTDTAEAVVPTHTEASIGGVTMVLAGRYLDRYVRRDDGWRISHREVALAYGLPVGELGDLRRLPRVRWPEAGAGAAEER